MPRISASSPPDLRALAVLATVLAACATRDAVVGAVSSASVIDGGADSAAPALSSEFADPGGQWTVLTQLPGAEVTFGSATAGARDGRAVVLRLPGAAVSDPATNAGPGMATEIDSVAFLRYGTLRARVELPTCAPTEEVAAAMFWFYNDGQDRNGNGIADNPEIDMHVLCGTPSFLVFTAWSDYQLGKDGSETFLRASRAVDLATGDLYDGISDHERAYVKTGHDPMFLHPGFAPGATFQEIGIEWRTDRIRFFAVLDGAEVTLWVLDEARFIPQVPLQFCFNLWHPTTHWLPPAAPALYPAADALMRIDWFGYWPAP
jgi:hypothetical protein